jgi:hypothetical protein|tara:strand:- start:1597 stop:1803 length:207 start_codon:yes stop_codon:yes gene_type:complete
LNQFTERGGLGECAASDLRWEHGERQQSASGIYGAFGARSKEAVEMRVGRVAESIARSSAAPHQRGGV